MQEFRSYRMGNIRIESATRCYDVLTFSLIYSDLEANSRPPGTESIEANGKTTPEFCNSCNFCNS